MMLAKRGGIVQGGDLITYRVFKDYNGRMFSVATCADAISVRRLANDIVAQENKGLALTVRVFKQVYFVRKPKVKK